MLLFPEISPRWLCQVKSELFTAPHSQTSTAACDVLYLDIDEGAEVELVSGPLTHEELITLVLRQRVEELRQTETMAIRERKKCEPPLQRRTS